MSSDLHAHAAASSATGRHEPVVVQTPVAPTPTPTLTPAPSREPAPPVSGLGSSLEPLLRQACGNRLSAVRWFRSPWQRGGGSTGLATLATDHAGEVDVVVKLPVGPVEHRWSTLLSNAADPACPSPRILASGLEVGGYDLGWLVMERLPGEPLAHACDAAAITHLLHALHRWQQHAAAAAKRAGLDAAAGRTPGPSPAELEAAIVRSRDVLKRTTLPEAQKWNNQLKAVHRALPNLLAIWADRPMTCWCHGDTHPGNALCRGPRPRATSNSTGPPATADPAATANSNLNAADCPDASPVVLIDLALVHAGHWIEDALYLERVHWGRPDGLFGVNAVSTLARLRREAGLRDTEDYGRLAAARRVLAAACAPGLVEREGSPRYLHAALEIINKYLPMVAH